MDVVANETRNRATQEQLHLVGSVSHRQSHFFLLSLLVPRLLPVQVVRFLLLAKFSYLVPRAPFLSSSQQQFRFFEVDLSIGRSSKPSARCEGLFLSMSIQLKSANQQKKKGLRDVVGFQTSRATTNLALRECIQAFEPRML